MKFLIGRKKIPAFFDKEDYFKLKNNGYSLTVRPDGYVCAIKYLGMVNNKPKYEYAYAHRVIMNAPVKSMVDHINGYRNDNRKINLRLCDPKTNAYNAKKARGKYKGVFWGKENKKWMAQITKDYKCYHIGCFKTEEEAALAYNDWATKLHGEFARLNIIQ